MRNAQEWESVRVGLRRQGWGMSWCEPPNGDGIDRMSGEGMPEDWLHTDAVNTYNEEIQYTVRLGWTDEESVRDQWAGFSMMTGAVVGEIFGRERKIERKELHVEQMGRTLDRDRDRETKHERDRRNIRERGKERELFK